MLVKETDSALDCSMHVSLHLNSRWALKSITIIFRAFQYYIIFIGMGMTFCEGSKTLKKYVFWVHFYIYIFLYIWLIPDVHINIAGSLNRYLYKWRTPKIYLWFKYYTNKRKIVPAFSSLMSPLVVQPCFISGNSSTWPKERWTWQSFVF